LPESARTGGVASQAIPPPLRRTSTVHRIVPNGIRRILVLPGSQMTVGSPLRQSLVCLKSETTRPWLRPTAELLKLPFDEQGYLLAYLSGKSQSGLSCFVSAWREVRFRCRLVCVPALIASADSLRLVAIPGFLSATPGLPADRRQGLDSRLAADNYRGGAGSVHYHLLLIGILSYAEASLPGKKAS